MTTEIYSQTHGRSISTYDLLDQVQEAHDLSRREAHDAIHAVLQQLDDATNDDVILTERPERPELLEHNPGHIDINYWLTISDETAQEIRDVLAATYAH
ncbi:hypothetical protein [Streptomyces sp. NPDC047097]|uniref:hypothetical protein n=1 Tax=Streptomyces sp. NPDC047097 TaxID=3155260 RepID=UPI0033DFDB19